MCPLLLRALPKSRRSLPLFFLLAEVCLSHHYHTYIYIYPSIYRYTPSVWWLGGGGDSMVADGLRVQTSSFFLGGGGVFLCAGDPEKNEERPSGDWA